MANKVELTVGPESENERLDQFVASRYSNVTRSALKANETIIEVDGKVRKLSYKVRTGERVCFDAPDHPQTEVEPQEVDFELLYHDEDIAVVNKPAGLTVHPAHGHWDQTLVNGLMYRLNRSLTQAGGHDRPGIVHRLDKDTAGVMVVAISDEAHRTLSEDFKFRRIEKIYYAIVKGTPPVSGRIDEPIGRSAADRKKMSVRGDGKPSTTEYETIEELNGYTLMKIRLLTGRTHQIRVHFAYIGHPVAGDTVYARGAKRFGLKGIALVAKRIVFEHPITRARMEFEIELPEDVRELLEQLRKKSNAGG